MNIEKDLPVYSIGIAAKLLNVHPRTLRIYEDEELITPKRKGGKRFYSQNDIEWIQCLRHIIHEENISIPAIKKLLEVLPCWKIKKCTTSEMCTALSKIEKNCWELAQNVCENACKNCEIYLKKTKNTEK